MVFLMFWKIMSFRWMIYMFVLLFIGKIERLNLFQFKEFSWVFVIYIFIDYVKFFIV